MEIGFTGTRKGMTLEQKLTIIDLLQKLEPDRVDHGMCIGADEDFDVICHELGIARRGWPGVGADGSCHTRANCVGIQEIMPENPYKVRDRLIVACTEALIATPKGFKEELRSGTWMTVRIARRLDKIRYVVWPDGKISDRER